MKSSPHGPTKPDVLQGQGIHATSGSHLQCRTPPSHSSQTPGTPHRSASPLSARPHCILYGDSGTSGLSLSWAEALPWPRAWWGHPEEWGTDGEPRISLEVTSHLAIILESPLPRSISPLPPKEDQSFRDSTVLWPSHHLTEEASSGLKLPPSSPMMPHSLEN